MQSISHFVTAEQACSISIILLKHSLPQSDAAPQFLELVKSQLTRDIELLERSQGRSLSLHDQSV